MRTVPWVRDVARRYAARGLTVVGIHTPEFEHEHNRAAVASHARDHGLDFSHLLDNDYAYWNALANQYWPAVYLVDRCGRIRTRAVGEVHLNTASGTRLEDAIETLLGENAEGCRRSTGGPS